MPSLVLFCGVPGSGKTTIAKRVSQLLGDSVHVQTDSVRFMLARRRYTHEESKFVYDACIKVALNALQSGYNAILDATFLTDVYRQEALAILEPFCDRSLTVCLVCEEGVAYRRIKARRRSVPKPSFMHLYTRFETPRGSLLIDTSYTSPEDAALLIVHELSRQSTNITARPHLMRNEDQNFLSP